MELNRLLEIAAERAVCDLCADSGDDTCIACQKVKGVTVSELREYHAAVGTVLRRTAEDDKAREEGRLVVLPCAVGQTVWVISKCENVRMYRDDDYLTGTGAIECPFESSCDTEDCDDSHIRIFETVVSDFWYGDENEKRPEMFLEHMGTGYKRSDFGKSVFLTRGEAEAALGGGEGG